MIRSQTIQPIVSHYTDWATRITIESVFPIILKMKASWPFQTSGTAYSLTQHSISEELSRQLHHYKNVKCLKNYFVWMDLQTQNNRSFLFIPSIGMCRMRRFVAVLRSFFHSPLLRTFPCHPSPPTTSILPSSLTSSCHLFLGLPLNFLFPNSYTIPFWEFYILPYSVHAQTNIIYLTLLSLL